MAALIIDGYFEILLMAILIRVVALWTLYVLIRVVALVYFILCTTYFAALCTTCTTTLTTTYIYIYVYTWTMNTTTAAMNTCRPRIHDVTM